MGTSSVRVIGSEDGLTKIVRSHIRSLALARMLHSSSVAIFRGLLACCPPPLLNSSIVRSGCLGVIAGIASGFKTVGE